jgi:hypothetical protein
MAAASPPLYKTPRKLKHVGASLRLAVGSSICSDDLHASPVPSGANARDFYLNEVDWKDLPPPLVSHSEFVPLVMVEHLMKRKKDSALGVKFTQRGPGSLKIDEITNMEGGR